MDGRMLGWNGTGWARVRVDSAGRLYTVLGFESVVSGFTVNSIADVGYNRVQGDQVPSGKCWVITCCNAWNDTSSSTRIIIGIHNGSEDIWIKSVEEPAADQQLTLETTLVLEAGSRIQGYFYGCTAGDDIGIAWHGYQIEAP